MAKHELAIGIDLGGTSIRAGVVDARGQVTGYAKKKTHADRGGAAAVTERIVACAEEALAQAKTGKDAVQVLGVGVAGIVDGAKGRVRLGPNLGEGWTEFPLGRILAKHFAAPAWLENDVRSGATGEHEHGAGRDAKDMAAIFVGTGIGGGLILDGKLRRGFRGNAGEVGHTVVAMGNGTLGKTGADGTVEPIASRTGMHRRVKELVGRRRRSILPELIEQVGGGRLTSKVITQALREGDAVMQEVLAEAQEALGRLAANVANLVDVEVIVFGGGLTDRLGEEFVAPIREVAYANLIDKVTRPLPRIVPGELGDHAGVVGSAVLARKALL